MRVRELSRKDLKLSQVIRKEMRKNDNHIRKLLSKNDHLRTKLVRLMFKLDFPTTKYRERDA